MSGHKLVVRFNDGRVLKGTTSSFSTSDPTFVLRREDQSPGSESAIIDLRQVKALFFVRSFQGDPGHQDRRSFEEGQPYGGRRIQVVFQDGEVMVGSSPNFKGDGLGFYLFPADEESNTLKVFVVSASVKVIRPAEEEAAPAADAQPKGNER